MEFGASLERLWSKHKVLLLVGMIVLLSWGAYQAYKATLQDCSFLTDSSCYAPCWQGIIPGKTSRLQAVEILQSDHRIRQNSLQEGGSAENGGVTWFWKSSQSRFQSQISWENDIVDEITLGITCKTSVEQIISRFGPPTALDASKGGIPEHWYWIIDLYYPSIGAQFTACTSEFDSTLKESTSVEAARFFPSTSLEARIHNWYTSGGTDPSGNQIASQVMKVMRPWKGYGDLFEVYYNSPEDLVLE